MGGTITLGVNFGLLIYPAIVELKYMLRFWKVVMIEQNNERLIENATETLMKLRPWAYDQYGNIDCSGGTAPQ